MKEIFNILQKKCGKYPQLRTEFKEDFAIIHPLDENGFEIRIDAASDEYLVFFKGWHEHFSDVKEALNCVAFGLSKECRLKVFSKGGKEYKWIVEFFENEQWKEDSETGTVPLSFWKKKEILYFRNNLIERL